jgi:magnesium chelatase subunit I
VSPTQPSDLPVDVGALRATGYHPRSVKEELRTNLVAALRSGTPPFPGVVGFEDTVLPQVERAILAGHDFVLLGERGQGKTRLLRSLIGLLDEWSPAVAGCEINDDPLDPVCVRCQRLSAELGDEMPIVWRHREQRYGEKLATPDTSVGDLIGDVDPIKVAEGRTLGDPETVHYGLVPRTNRGIFALNELPDLAERIQVALLNVLEERDVQVRGYNLRLPLDLLVVASANPEDYTNRGRIITPLKDRFGAEVATHYPLTLATEVALIEQEADLVAQVPAHMLRVVARFTHAVRESSAVDTRSGVSARFAVATVETLAASALRRAAITGESEPVARVGDMPDAVATLRGKVEFDVTQEGREEDILQFLARQAVADEWRELQAAADMDDVSTRIDEGLLIRSGSLTSAQDLLDQLGPLPGLSALIDACEGDATVSAGVAAACVELALEGLWLDRRIGKDGDTTEFRYGP